MAFHLKAKEPVPEGLKRIAREELESAAGQLGGKAGGNRDEAIHEARKSLKKTRAVLRLSRKELGPVYREENARLRDLGRVLSGFRDAGAMIETLDALVANYKSEFGRRTGGSVRRALLAEKAESERSADIESTLAEGAKTLRAAAEEVEKWPLERDGFRAIEPGPKQSYARGRKAMAYAAKHPKAENYHEWRKRAKDLWYHVRLLEPLWTGVFEAYEKSLKDLETALGDGHNLVLLRERIREDPAKYGSAADVKRVLKFIGRRQAELRANAQALGARIYEEKPRQFIRRLAHLWDAWLSEPLESKKAQRQAAQPGAKAPATAA